MPLTLLEIVDGPYGGMVRESVVLYSAGSGFYVAPQIVGDRVNLEIHPVQQTFDAASPRDVVGQELRTTLTGRLLGKRQSESRETRQMWLKVNVVE
jgi:hypothetical protein